MTTTTARRNARIFALAFASTALTISGCTSMTPARFKDTRSMSAPYLGSMALDVLTVNGAIEVSQADSQSIEITAMIKARTQQRLDETLVVADQIDDTLVVRVEWPNGKRMSNEGCSFTIAMPATESITLKSSNGAISVDSLSGPADLDTSNGRITVTDYVGDIRAETSNGRIVLESIDGSVYADTSNGSVRIFGVTGPVNADTSNGAVVIELADGNPGPVQIDTGNGSVTLAVGDAFTGTLTTDTSNGSTHCSIGNVQSHKIGKNDWRFVFPGEGEASLIDTSNGAIKIKRIDSASAAVH